MKQSRGIRNNNPLNIRLSADKWQGMREEQTDKAFVQFKSMAYGYRAAWIILQSYYNRFYVRSKPFTVRNIISRWHHPRRTIQKVISVVYFQSLVSGERKTCFHRKT